MAKIGYARVSTGEQTLSLQLDALEAAGCEAVYRDEGVSGAAVTRPGLDTMLSTLAPGDVLTVWRLDRLGRSLAHLIGVIEELGRRNIGFQSLSERIDTTTSSGRLVFHMMGALAEFERSLIAERTKAGMQAAKRRGKHVGRRHALSPYQVEHARTLLQEGRSQREIAALLGVHHNTLNRALSRTLNQVG